MTKKACFAIQFTSMALIVVALVLSMVYCFGVSLPELERKLAENPDSNALGLGGAAYFLGILGYLGLGFQYMVIFALMFGAYMLFRKQPTGGFGLTALNVLAQFFVLLLFLLWIGSVKDGNVLIIIVAVVTGASCVLWAVQFWGSVRNSSKAVQA